MSTYLVHYSLTPNAKAIFPDFHFSFSRNDHSIPILPPLQIAVAQVRFSIPKRQLHGWNILYQTTVSRFFKFNTFCQQLSVTNKHFNKKGMSFPKQERLLKAFAGMTFLISIYLWRRTHTPGILNTQRFLHSIYFFFCISYGTCIALRTVHFALDFHVELNLRFCSGRTYRNFCTVGCKELKYV